MTKPIQNNSENSIRRNDIYMEFIRWFALPPFAREHSGIITQQDFAKEYKVSKDTLSLWKRSPDFSAQVTKLRNGWGFERTGDVLQAIYASALKGNAASQKLWMDYFPSINLPDEDRTPDILVSIGDIRFLIFLLPRDRQQKHFDWIRDLLLEAMDFGTVPDDYYEEEEEFEEKMRMEAIRTEVACLGKLYCDSRDFSLVSPYERVMYDL